MGDWLAVLVSLATLVVAVIALVTMKVHVGGFQLVSNHTYTGETLGIRWYLGVDGISIFLVLLTAVLFPLVLITGQNKPKPRAYAAWMLLLEAAVMGSFLSLDLIVFFFFFELTLVPAYFIIAGWGHDRRAYAAVKFFLYTFLGSAFLLVGILALAFIHQSQTGVLTFSLPALEHTHLSSSTEILLFLAFTSAFAVKAPLFPFHTWSPDAYTEAPAGGSVILSSVLAKLGTYGIIRFDLTLFPQATRTLAPLILTLAVIGIVYGAIVACAQRDMKRLVAYSSLAQIGFIALGTFALSTQGLSGAVLLMLNHGLIVAGLFLVIGFIYERRGTWQTTELRGPAEGGTGHGGGVHRLHDGLHRRARTERVRQRVPGARGHVPHPPLVGRGGRPRRDRGRHLPAVDLPAGVPRRAQARGRKDQGPVLAGAPGGGAADHPHRLPGRLSQAGARPHRPVGDPTGGPCREGHGPLPATGGRSRERRRWRADHDHRAAGGEHHCHRPRPTRSPSRPSAT